MKINKTHRTAMELMVSGEKSMEQIAATVKKSRQTLYNWLEDEDFRAEYNELLEQFEKETRMRLRGMTRKALNRQEKILEKSNNDMAAASVAADVLDRAGYTKENVVNVSTDIAPVQIINNIPRRENRENGN